MYDGMNAVEGYWGGKCNLRRWDAMVPLSMAAAAQWMITARRAEGITATRAVLRWQAEFRWLLANCPAV